MGLKLGYAPTRRKVFSVEAALEFKQKTAQAVRDWGAELVDLEGLNDEGLMWDASQVPGIVDRFTRAGVDGLFVPHCNFGTEAAVGPLARALRVPVLLWGPRDEGPDAQGNRLRDSQCGLFATSKVLRRVGVPFTYITNSTLDDPVFERGYRNFVSVARVVRAARGVRIGQIGPRPDEFWTVMCNEGELLERFNIEVLPISLAAILHTTHEKLEQAPDEVDGAVAELAAQVKVSAEADAVRRLMAMKLAMQQWAQREGLDALAMQCWPALQQALGVFPCLVNGLLTGGGLPVACETDIHGAFTSVVLGAAVPEPSPTFFADLTVRHPEDDNVELLWHCGVFPPELCDDPRGCQAGPHFNLPRPVAGEFRIKGGDITVARFDGDRGTYRLFMGHGQGVDGPYNRGTYTWLRVGDWPRWEEKFIRGPYIHHVAGVHGHVAPVLYEACRYIDGLDPDPVEPDAAAIEAWLRGTGAGPCS